LIIFSIIYGIALAGGYYIVSTITSRVEGEGGLAVNLPAGGSRVSTGDIQKSITPETHTEDGEEHVDARSVTRTVAEKDQERHTTGTKAQRRSKVTSELRPVTHKKEARGEKSGVPKRQTVNKRSRDRYLYMARKYETAGDYANALKYYREALVKDASDAPVLNNIAYIFIKMHNPSMAIRYAREALKTRADYIPAMINLSIGLAMEGKYTLSEDVLKRALKIDEHNNDVTFNIAILYERLNRLDSSMKYYRRLAGAGDVRGDLGMARIYEKRHEYKGAGEIYRRLMASQSLDPNTVSYVRKRLALIMNKIYLDKNKYK